MARFHNYLLGALLPALLAVFSCGCKAQNQEPQVVTPEAPRYWSVDDWSPATSVPIPPRRPKCVLLA